MDPHIAEFIGPLVAMLSMGTFTLIGLRMFLSYRARRLELTAQSPSAQLEVLVDDLRQEVQALRGDVADLHERVDFAERLLAKGRE